MPDCLFCKIVAGVIPCYKIWEDDAHLAFLDIHPIQEGHTLVIPKAHASYLFEMDDSAYHTLLRASKTVAAHLKTTMQVPRIGVGVEGFAVDHVHIHLVPVTGIGQLDSSKTAPEDHAVLAQLAEKIRTK